jgi:hypothetical protein
MNRAIKRQQKRIKEKENVCYKYTPNQLKSEIQMQIKIANEKIKKEELEIQNNATREIVNMMISVFALSLHDEAGFGSKRIEKVMIRVQETFSCIKTKHVSYDEIKQELKRLKINF